MLKEMLEKHLQRAKSVPDWPGAIRLAAAPLFTNGFIEARYIDKMIQNVQENGPYIVIADDFAMPHARPEHGVLKTGLALLQLSEPVLFPEDTPARLLMVLAANDANIHIKLIGELTELLMEEGSLEKLLAANSEEEIIQCLSPARN